MLGMTGTRSARSSSRDGGISRRPTGWPGWNDAEAAVGFTGEDRRPWSWLGRGPTVSGAAAGTAGGGGGPALGPLRRAPRRGWWSSISLAWFGAALTVACAVTGRVLHDPRWLVDATAERASLPVSTALQRLPGSLFAPTQGLPLWAAVAQLAVAAALAQVVCGATRAVGVGLGADVTATLLTRLMLAGRPLVGFGGQPALLGHPAVAQTTGRLGVTPVQVALAWLLAQAPNILLIPPPAWRTWRRTSPPARSPSTPRRGPPSTPPPDNTSSSPPTSREPGGGWTGHPAAASPPDGSTAGPIQDAATPRGATSHRTDGSGARPGPNASGGCFRIFADRP